MYLRILTPDQIIYDGETDMIVLPGDEGDLGILKHHVPLMASLRAGEICLYHNEKISQKISIQSGFVQVTPAQCLVYIV